MITLDVKEYCHNCDGFVPIVVTSYLHGNLDEINKVVRCENDRKCTAIARYIERSINGETHRES